MSTSTDIRVPTERMSAGTTAAAETTTGAILVTPTPTQGQEVTDANYLHKTLVRDASVGGVFLFRLCTISTFIGQKKDFLNGTPKNIGYS